MVPYDVENQWVYNSSVYKCMDVQFYALSIIQTLPQLVQIIEVPLYMTRYGFPYKILQMWKSTTVSTS